MLALLEWARVPVDRVQTRLMRKLTHWAGVARVPAKVRRRWQVRPASGLPVMPSKRCRAGVWCGSGGREVASGGKRCQGAVVKPDSE